MNKFNMLVESVLSEGKTYDVEIDSSSMQDAMSVFKDSFKRIGKMDSDGTFKFKSIEDAAEFIQALSSEYVEDDAMTVSDEIKDYVGME